MSRLYKIQLLVFIIVICTQQMVSSQTSEIEGKLLIVDSLEQQVEIINRGPNGIKWRLSSSSDAWNAGGGKFLINNSSNSSASKLAITNSGNVGIGTTDPMSKLSVNGKINIGNDALSNQEGDLRYNSTAKEFEGYNGTSWSSLSGGSSTSTPYEIRDLVDQNTVIGTYDGSGSVGDFITMAIDGFAGIKIEKNPINDLIIQFPNAFNTGNTLVGDKAGLQLETTENTLIGANTGEQMTKAINSTAVGSRSLTKSISNSDNTAIGYRSLSLTGNGTDDLTTGNDNTAAGSYAGEANLTGSKNIFIGSQAGKNGPNNEQSIFIGYQAGRNADDEDNIGIGYQALYSAGKEIESGNLGKRNVAVGSNAGKSGTEAYNNVFMGYDSGRGVIRGYNNSYIGHSSGKFNNSGHHNTSVGDGAGSSSSSTSGNYNVNIGSSAGFNGSGDFNTRIGRNAGQNGAGNLNVFLGHEAGFNEDVSNTLIISNDRDKQLIYGEFDNDIVRIGGDLQTEDGDIFLRNLGGTNTDQGIKFGESNNIPIFGIVYDGTGQGVANKIHIREYNNTTQDVMTFEAGGDIGINTTTPDFQLDVNGTMRGATLVCGSTAICSDLRFKNDVLKIESPLSKVLNLNGYTHYWKDDKKFSEWGFGEERQLGFIAQEVQKIVPEVVKPINDEYLSVEYGKLTPLLVEAIKEQQALINKLEERIDQLESKNE